MHTGLLEALSRMGEGRASELQESSASTLPLRLRLAQDSQSSSQQQGQAAGGGRAPSGCYPLPALQKHWWNVGCEGEGAGKPWKSPHPPLWLQGQPGS